MKTKYGLFRIKNTDLDERPKQVLTFLSQVLVLSAQKVIYEGEGEDLWTEYMGRSELFVEVLKEQAVPWYDIHWDDEGGYNISLPS